MNILAARLIPVVLLRTMTVPSLEKVAPMRIGSQDVAQQNSYPDTRKGSLSFGEFLLYLSVILVAILLGVAGGIWLAKRDLSSKQEKIVPSQASLRPSGQPPSPELKHGEAGLPPPVLPESRAATREPAANVILLGFPSIRAIHHSDQQDFTEIAIELRAAVLLRAAKLHNPERIYLDLAEKGRRHSPKGRLKSRREVALEDSRVAGVRVVRWESGAVRIVVDLKRSCEYSYRLSSEPLSRIIVELRARTQGALASRNRPFKGTTSAAAALAANRP